MIESFLTPEALSALFKVIMIDLVLAGDNAIVIGMAAAGLPKDLRNKAILVGIIAATVLRIGFAIIATQLLQVPGLLLIGGLLLAWVCWKMWRELRDHSKSVSEGVEAVTNQDFDADGKIGGSSSRKTFSQAAWLIVIADISMSLDNVLAVAGAARDHPEILIFGLVLSIAMMGFAATFIAGLLQRHRWIAYVGLAIIIYVAGEMIYRGGPELFTYFQTLSR